jgi:apolipoprotein N-acyltransferase
MRARNSYLLALLSGVLLLLSLPPFRFGMFLAWFALVPIFIAIFYENSVKTIGRLTKITALGALPICIWAAWWIPDLSYALNLEHLFWLWFVLGLGLAILLTQMYYGDFVSEYYKPKQLPSKVMSYLPLGLALIALPVIWTATEFLALNIPVVMRVFSIFGFGSIAKTQWLNPAILKLSSFTGMYGVTFLIVLVNCAIVHGIIHYREAHRISKATITVLVIFALAFVYGVMTIPPPQEGDITAAIVQSPQDAEDIPQQYLDFSKESLKYEPQFVIWPMILTADFPPESHADFAQANGVYVSGGVGEIASPDGATDRHTMGYHMVTLFQQIGKADVQGIFCPDVKGIDTDFGKLGIVVCIESGSTLPARDLAGKGTQFFIVNTGGPNVSIFSWVLGTNAIFRAAENRMFVACPIGDHTGSALIDPYGRIINDIAPEPEIVAGRIAFNSERTFYSKYGDIFGWALVGLLVILISYNLYLKRKSPYVFCKKCRTQLDKGIKVCLECGKKQ